MFVLRPVPHHFLVWLLLAPLLLVEVYALDAFTRVIALQDPARARIVLAEVVEQRDGAQGPEIRYQFRLPGAEQPYFARGMFAPTSQWVPISAAVWANAARRGTVEVAYLPEDPWTNQLLGRQGYPVADSFCLWAVFLVFDLVWLFESFVVVRNFVHTQAMVERRTPHRVRFWESRQVSLRR